MNKENGITIVMLIITLIVMLIIISVTINSGIVTLEEEKRSKFVQEMTLIQQKVNAEYIKIKNGDKTEENYGKSIEQ